MFNLKKTFSFVTVKRKNITSKRICIYIITVYNIKTVHNT